MLVRKRARKKSAGLLTSVSISNVQQVDIMALLCFPAKGVQFEPERERRPPFSLSTVPLARSTHLASPLVVPTASPVARLLNRRTERLPYGRGKRRHPASSTVPAAPEIKQAGKRHAGEHCEHLRSGDASGMRPVSSCLTSAPADRSLVPGSLGSPGILNIAADMFSQSAGGSSKRSMISEGDPRGTGSPQLPTYFSGKLLVV